MLYMGSLHYDLMSSRRTTNNMNEGSNKTKIMLKFSTRYFYLFLKIILGRTNVMHAKKFDLSSTKC